MQVRTYVCTNCTFFYLHRLMLHFVCVCVCMYFLSHHITLYLIIFFYHISSQWSHQVYFQYIYLTLFRIYVCMYVCTCSGATFSSREWNYSLQVSNHAHALSVILFNFNVYDNDSKILCNDFKDRKYLKSRRNNIISISSHVGVNTLLQVFIFLFISICFLVFNLWFLFFDVSFICQIGDTLFFFNNKRGRNKRTVSWPVC